MVQPLISEISNIWKSYSIPLWKQPLVVNSSEQMGFGNRATMSQQLPEIVRRNRPEEGGQKHLLHFQNGNWKHQGFSQSFRWDQTEKSAPQKSPDKHQPEITLGADGETIQKFMRRLDNSQTESSWPQWRAASCLRERFGPTQGLASFIEGVRRSSGWHQKVCSCSWCWCSWCSRKMTQNSRASPQQNAV